MACNIAQFPKMRGGVCGRPPLHFGFWEGIPPPPVRKLMGVPPLVTLSWAGLFRRVHDDDADSRAITWRGVPTPHVPAGVPTPHLFGSGGWGYPLVPLSWQRGSYPCLVEWKTTGLNCDERPYPNLRPRRCRWSCHLLIISSISTTTMPVGLRPGCGSRRLPA